MKVQTHWERSVCKSFYMHINAVVKNTFLMFTGKNTAIKAAFGIVEVLKSHQYFVPEITKFGKIICFDERDKT